MRSLVFGIAAVTIVGGAALPGGTLAADTASSPPDDSEPLTLGEQGYLTPSFEWLAGEIRVTIGDDYLHEPVESLTCNGVTTEAGGSTTITVELTEDVETFEVECSIPNGVRFGLALPGIERNRASFVPNEAAYEAFDQCSPVHPLFMVLSTRIWPPFDTLRMECPVDVGQAWFEPADASVSLALTIDTCIPTWDNADCPGPPAPASSESIG
ncbi:MAG: hypothetical protein GX610_16465 [Rhodococcus sp.]|nr:hypothetical protein [Rhodococcus sp. (in: high G+C Gram-positive bacteria)]